LVYEDTGKTEELEKINKSIDKRYDEINERIFKAMQKYLPYKIAYRNLKEASRYLEDVKRMTKEINNAR
jgi:phosphate uptake regulator